jgi:rhodanese-related sulfurtransferase
MTRERSFQIIDIEAARDLIRGGEALIVDVRDETAFDKSHIAAAQRVADANLYDVLSSTPKTRAILIYCYHGHASRTYAKIFADFGFREVYSLDGGFEAWRHAKAPS